MSVKDSNHREILLFSLTLFFKLQLCKQNNFCQPILQSKFLAIHVVRKNYFMPRRGFTFKCCSHIQWNEFFINQGGLSHNEILMNEALEKVRRAQELQAKIQNQMSGLMQGWVLWLCEFHIYEECTLSKKSTLVIFECKIKKLHESSHFKEFTQNIPPPPKKKLEENFNGFFFFFINLL